MKYFDYTATTLVDEEVLNVYNKVSRDFFANSTSLHRLGEESNHMYEVCKKGILDILKSHAHNLIFASNATEANNIAILGEVLKHDSGKIITTSTEHPSVLNTIKSLEDRYDIKYIGIKEDGDLDYDALEKEMDSDVILVSIMWVNNILGTINNIKKIISIVSKYPKAKLHIDGVQGLCKVNMDFDINDVDLFTFSIHKIYGPKGVAGLLVKDNIFLKPILFGSNNQYKLKPGTLDVALIASAYKTIKKYYPLIDVHQEDVSQKWMYLKEKLEKNPLVRINTRDNDITHYILNISICGIKGETVVHILEKHDIYVSTGSSCSSKLESVEKTIYAMTNDEDIAKSSIRISLSFLTTYSEIDDLVNAINAIEV